jgi:hypothetical protein
LKFFLLFRRRNTSYVRNVNQGPGTLYNWQATKTTVKERFAFMFNNEILADVHFKVGAIKRVRYNHVTSSRVLDPYFIGGWGPYGAKMLGSVSVPVSPTLAAIVRVCN